VRSCIVDGEAIAVDENGLSVFDLVRNSAKTESSNASAGSLICYVGRTMAWLNEHYRGDGAVIYKHACALGCEGIVSKRLGSPYRAGRSAHWLKIKNPDAPAVKREAEEDWGKR
jgi:ATP-dependent DNA ligase